jgi:sec-independent protein translocase protein TatC
VPMCLLYEIGLFFARLAARKKAEAEAEAADAYRPMTDEEMERELDR